MEQILYKVVNEAGRLLRADEMRFADSGGFVTAVTLTFERLTIHITTLPDDDTISVRLDSPPEDSECVTVTATKQSPWVGVYGGECRWAWSLTNQQGYRDGVRLEFRTDAGSRVIELIVVASEIHYYEFTNSV